jgi:peptide/nickel transport system substrate-binding protein
MSSDERSIDIERLRSAWAMIADSLRAAEIADEEVQTARAMRDRQASYLASMAHELKNPLNAIYAYAQWLQMPQIGIDEAARIDKVATIETAAKHLIGLVGDLLTNEQIETGNLAVDPEPFELQTLLDEVIALERPAVESNSNTFVLDAADAPGRFVSDRRRITQVLINLLGNAAKFTKHGEVKLSVLRESDGSVRFVVADTGIGIAPERKARLFEAFSSIGGKEARKAGGHGLGLHITSGLVARLGGNIEIESTVGAGTTVIVWLPDLSNAGQAVRPADSDILTMGFIHGLPSLDPMVQQLDIDSLLLGTVYETLTAIGANHEVCPMLATSWRQLNPDTWMLRLDRKALFHNGDAMTSADVVATFKRLRRMLDSTSLETQSNMPDFTACEAVDDYTVALRTRHPSPLLLEQLSFIPIVHRSVGDVKVGAFGLAHVNGTGPYRMTEYGAHGFRLVARRRPGHADANWNVVLGRKFGTALEAETALLNGRIDVMQFIGRDLARSLARGSAIRVVHRPTDYVQFLLPNMHRAARGTAFWPDGRPIDANPLADPRVRRAISAAIDRDFLCRHAMLGEASPLASPVPKDFFGADPNLKVQAYDPARARRLLAEAGYPDGFQIAIRVVDTVDSDDRQLLRSLQAQLTSCGIRLRPEYLALREFASHDRAVPFGFLLINWQAPLADAETILRDFAAIPDPTQGFGACNYGHIDDPELDGALRLAARSLDRAVRDHALRKACRIVERDCLMIPLVKPDVKMVCRGHLDVVGQSHLWIRPDHIVVRDAEVLLIDQLLST